MNNSRAQQVIKKLSFYFNIIFSERIKSNVQQALPFWLASLLVGFIAVGYTALFNYAETLLHNLLQWHFWMIFIVAPGGFLLAWMIVRRWAPNAKGSGIPQVMAAIELSGRKHHGKVSKLLGLKLVFTKIGSSLMMIFAGGAIGREGPTIQIAGSIFYVVNRFVPRSWPRLSRQNYIITGAAAGLAAAFNTPLGGVVFAMEELAKVHIRFFRTALFTAVIIAGLTAQALLGPYLYLGYPDVKALSTSIFLGVFFTAIVAGVFGAAMCKGIIRIMRWKKFFSTLQSVIFILSAGLLVAFLAFFVDRQIIGSGKELMNDTLFSAGKSLSWHTVLMRIAGPVIAFNTGAAGGVFAPSLAAGASVGAFVSGLFDIGGGNANILILSGMVAFLTGVTRTPFTSAILVLEMTDRHSVIFHLMLAALISNLAALIVERHSFYDQLKQNYIDDALSDSKKTASSGVE